MQLPGLFDPLLRFNPSEQCPQLHKVIAPALKLTPRFLPILLLGLLSLKKPHAQALPLTGRVVASDAATPVAGAWVSAPRLGRLAISGPDGIFTINPGVLSNLPRIGDGFFRPGISGGTLSFASRGYAEARVKIIDAMGNSVGEFFSNDLGEGVFQLPVDRIVKKRPGFTRLYLLLYLDKQLVKTFPLSPDQWRNYSGPSAPQPMPLIKGAEAPSARVQKTDSLYVSAAGFTTKAIPLVVQQGDLGVIQLESAEPNANFTLSYDLGSSALQLGAGKLDQALKAIGTSVTHRDIALQDASSDLIVQIGLNQHLSTAFPEIPELAGALQKEGFHLRQLLTGGSLKWLLQARDTSGAMYGLLEFAEMIQMNKGLAGLSARQVNPKTEFRAVKFNLPWSSYRTGAYIDQHFDTVRDINFWVKFLDNMAENRFNALTLWNMHPYPFLIRAKNYPKATSFSDAELAEWRTFWTALFRLAKERGIETYLVHWNIVASRGFRDNYDASVNLDTAVNENGSPSPTIDAYTKQSVTQVLNEYPDLTGIGLTLGEVMGGMTPQQRQSWANRTIIAGIKEANRPAKLIHRVPLSAGTGSSGSTNTATEKMTREAIESITGVEGTIWVEVKFNWSHGHSTPVLEQTHGGIITDSYWKPAPKNYSIVWTVRNEDFFMLRWGKPGFIREHIALNGTSFARGYIVGAETFIPAREYIHVKGSPHVTWQYEFQRQWAYWEQWGRLLYNPNLPDDVFVNSYSQRYGSPAGKQIKEAMEFASNTPLRIASFYYSKGDMSLHSASLLSGAEFITLEDIINSNTLSSSYATVKEAAAALVNNKAIVGGKTSPLVVADSLEQESQKALQIASGINTSGHPTLACEVEDVKAWGHLGLYFANKLRGAVSLQVYRLQKQIADKNQAVDFLEKAQANWEDLIAVTKPHLAPTPMMHLRGAKFHWEDYRKEVAADIATAKK